MPCSGPHAAQRGGQRDVDLRTAAPASETFAARQRYLGGCEICSRSCWAITASRPMVSRLARQPPQSRKADLRPGGAHAVREDDDHPGEDDDNRALPPL